MLIRTTAASAFAKASADKSMSSSSGQHGDRYACPFIAAHRRTPGSQAAVLATKAGHPAISAVNSALAMAKGLRVVIDPNRKPSCRSSLRNRRAPEACAAHQITASQAWKS